jgi:hypothetical protein
MTTFKAGMSRAIVSQNSGSVTKCVVFKHKRLH